MVNDERTFWVNVPLVWVALPIAAIIGLRFVIIPASFMVVSVVNGLLHVGMGIKNRKYNPGFLASLSLNLPLGCYILFSLAQASEITPTELGIAVGLGLYAHALIPLYFIRLKMKGGPVVS